MVRSVSTIHELDIYLARLYPGAKTYEDLKLGPLVKHRLVYDYFKFPSNLDPPEITTLKVMKYLREFMTRNGWTNTVNFAEFLEYLREQMSCESLYDLGIRIESIALMVKVRFTPYHQTDRQLPNRVRHPSDLKTRKGIVALHWLYLALH